MNHQVFKIHNQADFNRITRGIKVARCMQVKSSSVSDTEKILNQLEDLSVSDSLTCSFCNTIFEDKIQQRLHYKLDWHRYNLKQRLNGLKSVSEYGFSLLSGELSSLSSSDLESEDEEEAGTPEIAGSASNGQYKHHDEGENTVLLPDRIEKRLDGRNKDIDCIYDSPDSEDDEVSKRKKIQAPLAVANRHSKVFFENDDGQIFSIYRCLLHNKKEIPEVDKQMVAQALDTGRKLSWTVIMIGGGHFAAAVFQDGEPVIHKTFHSYLIRAKQGSAQCSRDNRTVNHAKSAGASLRRYNETLFIQHVQDILESWNTYIDDSSLILYRAVGPYNRTVLFGGRKPALDKNDIRLRPLPFPTRRATFNEVKRVYDILSTMEIYGPAIQFTDRFPISPRQPSRKRSFKTESPDLSQKDMNRSSDTYGEILLNHDKFGRIPLIADNNPQHRRPRPHIDRAKPRRSPRRPLPDIVARLAKSSSESELDERTTGTKTSTTDFPFYEETVEIDFADNLVAFQNGVPRYMQNKKARQQKKTVKRRFL